MTMVEGAGRLAVRGQLLVDGGWLHGALVIEAGRIAEVVRGDAPLDGFPGRILAASHVAPGLIDLQVNGGFGVEVGDAASLAHLAAQLPRTGVTSFLPTLVTAPAEVYSLAFDALRTARGSPGAAPLGWHLEGPFLSASAAGAHDPRLVEAAADALFAALVQESALRVVTLAPERPGALARIGALVARGVVVSLGHTAATYEAFRAGVDAGATMATHLYSAMSGFHHRAPGAVGSALTDDRVHVGLIADGVHCHAAAIHLALRAKGPDRVVLVTDAMAAAGMPPGDYELMGTKVIVDATSARLEDGTLAGSIVALDQAVRHVVATGAASLEDALRMASEVPARLLGERNKGRIARDADADLVLLDADATVRATVVGGVIVHERC